MSLASKLKTYGGLGKITMNAITNRNSKNFRVIHIDNPTKRNAVSPNMMVDLEEIIGQLERDTKSSADHPASTKDNSISAVIITGKNSHFCSGFDLSSSPALLSSKEFARKMNECMTSTLARLHNLPVLTVSAIDGFAYGGGAELTTATDFRIWSSNARLKFVHAKMGLSPGWGGKSKVIGETELHFAGNCL